MTHRLVAIALAGLAALSIGCPPGTHTPAPAIVEFAASPATISQGQGTTLSWTVIGADTLTIDAGVGAVTGTSVVVSPTADTTYTLTAEGPGGAATATASVTVLPAADVTWTWIAGSDATDQAGTYGTRGVAAAGNVPGARDGGCTWRDSSGDLWLFGGAYWTGPSSSSAHMFNDLWKFDGTRWTWVSGSNTFNQPGTYGTKGTAAAGNAPGGRHGAVAWLGQDGTFWLFGGEGYDSAGALGSLNDLWKFDGTSWTWVSGSAGGNAEPTYGTRGVAAAANVPGARVRAVSWTGSAGEFYLFGGDGEGVDSGGELNDLWRFDGTRWTWLSGSTESSQPGHYGTRGVADAANVPGAREQAVGWIDDGGDLWLFGGYGSDAEPAGRPTMYGPLNDLWKFDGTAWTWISGSDLNSQGGVYGTRLTPDAGNTPGARKAAMAWTRTGGELWLFGGIGQAGGTYGFLDDLWRFDGTAWTWVSGANWPGQRGTYGTQGVSSATSVAGARIAGGTWVDPAGDLWLFGGNGFGAAAGAAADLNDLWKLHIP
jgi:hypothetical protein